MKKSILITTDEDIFNYLKDNHISKSKFINEAIREYIRSRQPVA